MVSHELQMILEKFILEDFIYVSSGYIVIVRTKWVRMETKFLKKKIIEFWP